MTSHRFLKLANLLTSACIEVCLTDNAIAATLRSHTFTDDEISQVKAAMQELANEHTQRSLYHERMEAEETAR